MNLKWEKSFERYVNVRECPLATGSIALNAFKIGFFLFQMYSENIFLMPNKIATGSIALNAFKIGFFLFQMYSENIFLMPNKIALLGLKNH